MNPKILEDYFFEDCMEVRISWKQDLHVIPKFQASSEDVDDEEFFIKINFGMFALPEVDSSLDISKVRTNAQVSD